ncbi:MAG: alpha-amylase [Bacteroidota bacterium]|nr:MAG: alpha-amylase [Bacteroidota bacterium]
MKRLIYLIALLPFFVACEKNNENLPPVDEPGEPVDTTDIISYTHHQEWSYNKGLYEVNIRQYTPEGTFDAFAAHLPRLKEMGVGILWLMPINPIGVEKRLGSLGSYYSISNYQAINPEFGNMTDFKELVEAIHDAGMYVVIDWVANHTSWDNVLTTAHPEFYVTNTSGEFIPPPGTNWSDVIELNYANRDLRAYMIESMEFWVKEAGIDGFRCDAVDFVPLDFWKAANDSLKKLRPDLLMLAEGEGTKYHNNGFDMTYAWSLHGFEGGILTGIYEGTKNVSALDNFLTTELTNYSGEYRLYFTSNHDENSWVGTDAEQYGVSAPTFASLTHTLFGMPMIYSGQEAGLNKRFQFFEKDLIPWNEHSNKSLYTSLLDLKKNNKALWNGTEGGDPQRINTTANTKVFAIYRQKDEHKVFAYFNLSAQQVSFEFTGTGFEGSYTELFSDTVVEVAPSVSITLAQWEYRVLHVTPEN